MHRYDALSSNTKRNTKSPKLYAAIRKYGWENFSKEVIANCVDKQSALAIEEICVLQYDSYFSGLNSSFGGAGFIDGDEHPMKLITNRLKVSGKNHYLHKSDLALEKFRKLHNSETVRTNKSLVQNNPEVRLAKSIGISHGKSKLSDDQVRLVREYSQTGFRICDIVKETMISRSQIKGILSSKTYEWVK